jgi:hypothetical protein
MLTEATTARRAIVRFTSNMYAVTRARHFFFILQGECALQLNPHLVFKDECEAAFKFYEKCLNGKIPFMMPHEGTPMTDQVPAAWCNKILHATESRRRGTDRC